MLGVRSWGSGTRLRFGGEGPGEWEGFRKRLRGRQGLQFEDPQPDLQFPEVFRKEKGMGSSKSSGSCGSTFLSSLQLRIAAFSSGPTLFLSSDLIKVKVPPSYPPAHTHIFRWGLCSLVRLGSGRELRFTLMLRP